MNNFRPMLLPNQQLKPKDMKYPLIASIKLDGIRCIFKDGEMISRSLKQIPNKQLQERFAELKKLSKEKNIILDGELYSTMLTFQQITHYVMTQDLESSKTAKKHGNQKLPEHLGFYCFDFIYEENYEEPYVQRLSAVEDFEIAKRSYVTVVPNNTVANEKETMEYFKEALDKGFEGLILRNPESKYKCGRVTLKSNEAYKMKPYETYDAVIKGVVQATVAREGSEKKINELGRSETSKKKEDRVLIEKAAAFLVDWKGKDLKVVIAENDITKTKIWKDKETYIGRTVEFKAMDIGVKDLPRHPTTIRIREDK